MKMKIIILLVVLKILVKIVTNYSFNIKYAPIATKTIPT